MSTSTSTSLRIRTTADPRILQRVVGVLLGRGCTISRLGFEVADRGSTIRLDVVGPPHLLRTAVARLTGLPHVLEVLPERADALGPRELRRLALTKLKVEVRLADGRRRVEATVGLCLDGDHVLAAGEGVGTVDAVAAAVQEGVSRLRPGHPRLDVADVRVDVWEGGTTAPVTVHVTARTPDGSVRHRGLGEDVGTAAADALLKLHAGPTPIGHGPEHVPTCPAHRALGGV